MHTQISGSTGVDKVVEGPAFSAYQNAGQVVTGIWTKVTLNVEAFDTDNCFDNTTSRFQPTTAGYYQLNGHVLINTASTLLMTIGFYKNGVNVSQGQTYSGSSSYGMSHSDLIYLNGASDYVELWFYGTGTITSGQASNGLSGFKARSA